MVSYSGKLYRALNPVYAREPMSGRGAALYGGRFNPKGVPALYTSTSVLTALREANQVGDLQPTTLVCYRAEIEMVFDTTDRAALEAVGLNEVALADPAWRDQMKTRDKHGPSALRAIWSLPATMGCSFAALPRGRSR